MKTPRTTPLPKPPILHSLAQLLAGQESNWPENGIPEPWKGVIDRVAGQPVENRKSALRQEIANIPGIEWDHLLTEIFAIDPARRSPAGITESATSLAKLSPVEPFPVDALPRTFANLVAEGAESIGCPPDYIGVQLLCLAGAAIGTSTCLQVKQDWCEQPSLYAAIVEPSGTKKTPA